MRRLLALRLGTKFNILVVSLLLLFSIFISSILNIFVTDVIKTTATEKAKGDLQLGYIALEAKYPGDWNVKDGELYKGSVLANNNTEMVDYIGELTNGTVTIFLGNKRVTTNVIAEGKRAIGTEASQEVINHTLVNGHNYYGEANVVGHTYQTAYQPIKDKDGSIIGMWYVGAPIKMVGTALKQVNTALFSTLIIFIIVATIVTIIFSNRIKKRLKQVGAALESAGKGDFTFTVNDRTGDEISALAANYSTMRENLIHLVYKMRESAETLAASSEQLFAGAEETAKASDLIAASLQDVANSANEQVASTDHLNETVIQMTSGIKQISDSSVEVQQSTANNLRASEQGIEIVGRTRKQVETIDQMTKTTSNNIVQLHDKSREIGMIINMITEISEQTNLLALNAAIEAARAGDQGRGFAVVADEVRKLAEQSNLSASQIKKLISGIQTDIELSVNSMESGRLAIDEGLQLATTAEKSFRNINETIQLVDKQINTVSEAVQELVKGTEEIHDSLDKMTNKIHSTSNSAQNVAAATEEQSASMQEVYASSQGLSKLAEELRDAVHTFKI
ncbi:methyl-accepting chemotaxis protein [Bacillus sp. Bva_UNVM-123]|uniref:methyl-accepting chemotaxis protein n=1 Tax=Bacillus sp. Bva_UNVM-123 TaxID=2829798 RepID=UPI00391F0A63